VYDADEPEELRCYRHPNEPTLVRCSNCERPICGRCMVASPVGVRCPECAGRTRRVMRPRAAGGGSTPRVTIGLIVLNVIGFALERGGDASTWAWRNGTLVGADVAAGDWWRPVTYAFLHANIVHIGANMYALWILGSALERYLGPTRYVAIYTIGILSGAAGALLVSGTQEPTVGASGAIFALLGAFLVLGIRGIAHLQPVLVLLALNVVFTVAVPGISIGGHIGGLLGGLAATFALELPTLRGGLRRGHVAYGRLGPLVVAALVAIALADVLLIALAVG
jgi:membrane associated rhomboid family serine protease